MAKRKNETSKAEQVVIQNGKLIDELMRTRGWRQLVEPMFDEMISSVIGVKKNGRWLAGHFIRSRKDEKKEFYIGYASALQEMWNSIQQYQFAAEIVRKRAEEVSEKVIIPMVEDGEEAEDV